MKPINIDDLENKYFTGQFICSNLKIEGRTLSDVIKQLYEIKNEHGEGIIFTHNGSFLIYKPYSLEDLIKNNEGKRLRLEEYLQRKLKILREIIDYKTVKINKYINKIEKEKYSKHQMNLKLIKMEKRRDQYYGVVRDLGITLTHFSDNYSIEKLRKNFLDKINELQGGK